MWVSLPFVRSSVMPVVVKCNTTKLHRILSLEEPAKCRYILAQLPFRAGMALTVLTVVPQEKGDNNNY